MSKTQLDSGPKKYQCIAPEAALTELVCVLGIAAIAGHAQCTRIELGCVLHRLGGECCLVGHDGDCTRQLPDRTEPGRALSVRFGVVGVFEPFDDGVDRRDQAIHQVGELGPFARIELAEDVHHRDRPASGDGIVASASLVGDPHEDHAAVLRRGEPLDEPVVLEALHGAGRGGGLDTEAGRQFLHRAFVAAGEQVEGVHLPLLERLLGTEQVRAQRRRGRSATEFDPGSPDAARVLTVRAVAEVDGAGSGG